ncbi:hypothetical protein N9119_02240 [Roseivirga sp.]|nr:hypothetical protein [Roseivirga sp.]
MVLENGEPTSSDASFIGPELNQAAALAMHAIDLGIARLETDDQQTKSIPLAIRDQLSADLATLIEAHKKLWLMSNREGGLKDSAAKLEDILEFYKN